jgi:hypothetical protein
MHKILALAQKVGGLSKYRRQMLAANVGGKCMQQMLAANLHGIVKLLRHIIYDCAANFSFAQLAKGKSRP